MPSPQPPTFVFIPGGWHLPDYFSPLIQALVASGYASETVRLNVNADPPLQDLEPEVEAILSRLRPLLEAGKNTIVVSHRYGGIPATEAVGRIVAESRQGKVLRLVYIAAFVPAKGDSMVSMLAEFEEALHPALVDFAPPYTTVSKAGYEILYHDVEQPYRSQLEEILGKHSIAAGVCPAANIGWRSVPSTFIHTTRDRCVLPSMQRQMVKKAKDTAKKEGEEWKDKGSRKPPLMPFEGVLGEFFIRAGHTVHVARMEEIKEILVALAKDCRRHDNSVSRANS